VKVEKVLKKSQKLAKKKIKKSKNQKIKAKKKKKKKFGGFYRLSAFFSTNRYQSKGTNQKSFLSPLTVKKISYLGHYLFKFKFASFFIY